MKAREGGGFSSLLGGRWQGYTYPSADSVFRGPGAQMVLGVLLGAQERGHPPWLSHPGSEPGTPCSGRRPRRAEGGGCFESFCHFTEWHTQALVQLEERRQLLQGCLLEGKTLPRDPQRAAVTPLVPARERGGAD